MSIHYLIGRDTSNRKMFNVNFSEQNTFCFERDIDIEDKSDLLKHMYFKIAKIISFYS